MVLVYQLCLIFTIKFSNITGGQIDKDALKYLTKKVEEALLKNVTQQLAKLGTKPTSENTTIAEQKQFGIDNDFLFVDFGNYLQFESSKQEKKWNKYIRDKCDPWMHNFTQIKCCCDFPLFASYHTERWKKQMKLKAFRKALRKVFAVMVFGDAVKSFRKAFASSK